MVQKFFQFLRYGIGVSDVVPDITSDAEWHEIYEMAVMQSILGVMFEGVQRLGGQDVKPPFQMMMDWVSAVEQIEEQNRTLNKKCVEVQQELHEAGLETCIIKGQGNAIYYPKPYIRMSGDIDVIVRNADRKMLTKWVKENKNLIECRFHHAEYEEDGIVVELHFVPCSMNNPMNHHRLQQWFDRQAEKDDIWHHEVDVPEGDGTITVPSREYNIVYQLAHMMHHFFDEGIGLRQMMDYYYLLRGGSLGLSVEGLDRRDKSVEDTLRHLGLWKFAGAVMYVMKEVFHMGEESMIAPVDERRGRTLLDEILKGGNFGKHSGLTAHSMGVKYFLKIRRNMRFVSQYPAEALCEPIFRTWHFFWRTSMR